MRYRALGRTGIEISEIGYGAWGIGGKLWRGNDDEESRVSLLRAIELGLNFIDTALAYGEEGHSEKLVGEIVRQAPGKVWVATKVPPKNLRWPALPGVPIADVFAPDHIVRCTETSLRNLGAETIDLQQLHVWNPEWLATESARDDLRRTIEDLKSSGKVRAFGISINDHQPDSALSLIRTGMIDTVQVIYNIFDQSPEASLFPLCIEHNIGVLARVPLDEGALTGAITPDSVFEADEFRSRYFKNDRKQQVVQHVDALQKDLTGVDGTLAEIALRFCLSAPAVSTVIPGMRKTRNVESSCGVSQKGPLPADVLARLKHHAWEKNFYK